MVESFSPAICQMAQYGRALHSLGVSMFDIATTIHSLNRTSTIPEYIPESTTALSVEENQDGLEKCFYDARVHYTILLLALNVNAVDAMRNFNELDYSPYIYVERSQDFMGLVNTLNAMTMPKRNVEASII